MIYAIDHIQLWACFGSIIFSLTNLTTTQIRDETKILNENSGEKEGKSFNYWSKIDRLRKNKKLLLDNSMISEWVMTSMLLYGNDGKKSISWHYTEQLRFTFEIAKINSINFYSRLAQSVSISSTSETVGKLNIVSQTASRWNADSSRYRKLDLLTFTKSRIIRSFRII